MLQYQKLLHIQKQLGGGCRTMTIARLLYNSCNIMKTRINIPLSSSSSLSCCFARFPFFATAGVAFFPGVATGFAGVAAFFPGVALAGVAAFLAGVFFTGTYKEESRVTMYIYFMQGGKKKKKQEFDHWIKLILLLWATFPNGFLFSISLNYS